MADFSRPSSRAQMCLCILWISKPSSKVVVGQLLLIPIAFFRKSPCAASIAIVYFSCFQKHSSFRTIIWRLNRRNDLLVNLGRGRSLHTIHT